MTHYGSAHRLVRVDHDFNFIHIVAAAGMAVLAACATILPLAPAVSAKNRRATANTRRLLAVEQNVLPAPLNEGPNHFTQLTDYYRDQNAALIRWFEDARRRYEHPNPRPLRFMTVVTGASGVGKTFIKGAVFDKKYPQDSICKLDLRELYERWETEGQVVRRAGLRVGNVVLSTHLAQKDPSAELLTKLLRKRDAAFYVIDSLDEVHADDYTPLLEEIERFVLSNDRKFVHVVVFGRPFAFREYCRHHKPIEQTTQFACHVLRPPRFSTVGDLTVSSWNYHCYKYKLSWAPRGAREPMPLATYWEWFHSGFQQDGPFASVTFKANAELTPTAQQTLAAWARRYPVIDSMLINLAGNGMVRAIVTDFTRRGARYDETQVMNAYFAALLERDARKHGRPSHESRPEQLGLYLRLLERVAIKYLAEDKVDPNGYFPVRTGDYVTVAQAGKMYRVSVHELLNHSGLVDMDCRHMRTDACRYRFEPVWIHRYLVQRGSM